MSAKKILEELKSMGTESYKKLMMTNHGVKEPYFGVKIGDMKKIEKRIKKDYQLALDLYDSGNYDAMYLAGLIADDAKMTKKDLQRWADQAYGGYLPGTVGWVAAGSPHGWDMALKWIDSKKDRIAIAGWHTLMSLVALKPDSELDLVHLEKLIDRVQAEIHQAPDLVRYAMNSFIISVGSYVKPLTEKAVRAGKAIGPVMADLGNNDCGIPYSPDYIAKVEKRGALGKKRKSVKC